MKQLLLLPLFLHYTNGPVVKKAYYPTVDCMTVRLAPWLINMQRLVYDIDTCYAIQFRDQSIMNAVSLKTMNLETMEQLKYFKEGLLTLKKGQHGDIAVYRNYSIKRVGTRKENTWYILSYDGAVTNFQEAQANRMIFIINDYIASQQ
jgi:hypothetical protein